MLLPSKFEDMYPSATGIKPSKVTFDNLFTRCKKGEMDRGLQFIPDRTYLNIGQLEKRVGYRHLDRNTYEDRYLFHTHLIATPILPQQLDLGKRFSYQIKQGFTPRFALDLMGENIGYGLFAQQPIAAGAYVGEYTGVVRKNDRRYGFPLNNYCYEYPVKDEMGRSYVIDATAGNFTRFINHSFEPNLKPIHVYYEGYFHLIFIALSEISSGDQLTYDYGVSYWYVRSSPCPL